MKIWQKREGGDGFYITMADIVVSVVRLASGQAKVILEKRQPSDNNQTTDIKVQLDERQETAFAAPMRSVGQYR